MKPLLLLSFGLALLALAVAGWAVQGVRRVAA